MGNYKTGRRLRVFGGPNGSGKSTVFEQIDLEYDIGVYLNADELEKEFKSKHEIQLADFDLKLTNENSFADFLKTHSLPAKAKSEGLEIDLIQKNNLILNPNQKTHSYEAAVLADFIRYELMSQGKKFTFETVMSHKSKIKFLEKAKTNSYKNYLYFVCTDSPEINVERVRQRVERGGHPVPKEKIISRYYRSLELLKSAVGQTFRTFIFDNTGKESKLILEVFEGSEIVFHHDEIPWWVDEYLLKK